MSLKVKIGALEVELESVEQVAELARRLENGAPQQSLFPQQSPVLSQTAPQKTSIPPIRNGWDRETAWQFLSSLVGTSQRFMSHLVTNRSLSSGDMAKRIEVAPNVLGPAIRSIKSKSKGLGKRMPFEIKPQSGGDGKLYVVSREFYEAASQPAPSK